MLNLTVLNYLLTVIACLCQWLSLSVESYSIELPTYGNCLVTSMLSLSVESYGIELPTYNNCLLISMLSLSIESYGIELPTYV